AVRPWTTIQRRLVGGGIRFAAGHHERGASSRSAYGRVNRDPQASRGAYGQALRLLQTRGRHAGDHSCGLPAVLRRREPRSASCGEEPVGRTRHRLIASRRVQTLVRWDGAASPVTLEPSTPFLPTSEVAHSLSRKTTESHRSSSGCSKMCSIPDNAGTGATG